MKGFSLGLSAKGAKPGAPRAVKPPAAAAFAAPGSDDDEADREAAAERPAKRGRWDTGPSPEAASTTTAATSSAPSEAHSVADKLADFVAKNGRKFEEITRDRNTADGPFRFLFEAGSPDHRYYLKRLQEAEQRLAGRSTAALPTPAPPPPAPPAAVPPPGSVASGSAAAATASAAAAAIAAKLAASEPGRAPPPPPKPAPSSEALAAAAAAAKAAAAGDSLAAMEAFAQAAKRHEQDRAPVDTREEILNETSFDRRRTTAVYKTDGKRGHHMQDFIPAEELATLLSASKDKASQEQAAALEASAKIQADNVGHKLLSMMGWKEGDGLGAAGAGRAAPVSAIGEAAGERRGLGTKAHTAAEEGDSEFDLYRKRMMVGYKHRSNPLGNPRKAYY